MKTLKRCILEPKPGQRVPAAVRVVLAQPKALVQLLEHVRGEQVFAQQQQVLWCGIADQQRGEVCGAGTHAVAALDDNARFRYIEVGRNPAPVHNGDKTGGDRHLPDTVQAVHACQAANLPCGARRDRLHHAVMLSLYSRRASSTESNQCARP
ncbi:hypothetical protein D9M68_498240 [compost metagenome]